MSKLAAANKSGADTAYNERIKERLKRKPSSI
jgi:hypothetical protein